MSIAVYYNMLTLEWDVQGIQNNSKWYMKIQQHFCSFYSTCLKIYNQSTPYSNKSVSVNKRDLHRRRILQKRFKGDR